MRRELLTALVAVLVLLAGCSAGPAGDAPQTTTFDGTDRTTTADRTAGSDDTTTADGSTPADSPDGGSADKSVQFYLSDRPNAIGDFDHLNVTVTKVGIHRAGNGSAGGEWLEYSVNATVDLTRLLGANATKIGSFDLPNGTYTKVFVYVSDTRGVMNGTETRVKLPSSKLQLNKGFTVGQGEAPSFVFDIAVHKAGKSGKYVLSPVVSESGTSGEVEIRDIDADETEADENEAEAETETATDDESVTTATTPTATTTTQTPTNATATATATTEVSTPGE